MKREMYITVAVNGELRFSIVDDGGAFRQFIVKTVEISDLKYREATAIEYIDHDKVNCQKMNDFGVGEITPWFKYDFEPDKDCVETVNTVHVEVSFDGGDKASVYVTW